MKPFYKRMIVVFMSCMIFYPTAYLLQVETIKWTFYIDDILTLTLWQGYPLFVLWTIGYVTGLINSQFNDEENP